MRFEEILVSLTVITGALWLLYVLCFKKKCKGKEPKWAEYSRSFFPVFLIVLLLRSFFMEPFRIPTGSMKPTLLDGDFILVNKYTYGLRLPICGKTMISVKQPSRGDILVFHQDDKDLIKRIVGVPGDRIRYSDTEKQLYINENPVKLSFKEESTFDGLEKVREGIEQLDGVEHSVYHKHNQFWHEPYKFFDVVVPDKSYFVMGDNRDSSHDSRFWGFVPDKEIVGKAVATWFSFDSQRWNLGSWESTKKLIRWDRIGKAIR